MRFKQFFNESSFVPPAPVAKAAERGLNAREKASLSNKGGLTAKQASKHGIGSGVQRVVNLKNRDKIFLSTIKRMKSFFDRHEGNYKKAKEKGLKPHESRVIQAWLLWGGNSGRKWAEKIISNLR